MSNLPSGLAFEELERAPARRVYKVRFPDERVTQDVSGRLIAMARNVRLPGFRPGKIPEKVLMDRYGAKAREEALRHLAAEAADGLLAQGDLASSIEFAAGQQAGDAEFRIATIHLPELDPIDFASIHVERLTGEPLMAGALENRLRRQVLDHLDSMYHFTVAPALISGEYARIRQEAARELAGDSITAPESAAIEAELRQIAERRVRLGVVVAEMARRHGLLPSPGEIQAGGISGEAASQTRDRLMEDRLINFILSHASVTARPATADELRDL